MAEFKEDYKLFTFKDISLRLIKNATSYGSYSFIRQFGAFFITPIYWIYLTPEDYGILAVTSLLQFFLFPIIILGLQEAVERFYFDWKDDDRKKKLGHIWMLGILCAITFTMILEYFGDFLFSKLFNQVQYHPYFQLAVWTMFFNSFSMIPFRVLRITEKVNTFGVISLLSFVFSTIFILIGIIALDLKAVGMLLGGLINSVLWAVFWIIWMSKRIEIACRFYTIREELLYSLPSVPINIINSVSKNFDRYLLEKFLSLSQLGFYNIGNSFGMYFNQANGALKTAWFPMVYKMFAQVEDIKLILPKLSLVYFYFLTIFALVASLLSKEIIFWFGNEKFIAAYQYIPFFVLSYLIMNFASAWGRGLDLAKKPQYGLISSLVSSAVCVVLMIILIPRYGAYGALASLILFSLVNTMISVSLAHYFYPRNFLFREVFLLFFLLFSFFYVGYQIDFDSTLLNFILKIIVILIYTFAGAFVTFGHKSLIGRLKKLNVKQLPFSKHLWGGDIE